MHLRRGGDHKLRVEVLGRDDEPTKVDENLSCAVNRGTLTRVAHDDGETRAAVYTWRPAKMSTLTCKHGVETTSVNAVTFLAGWLALIGVALALLLPIAIANTFEAFVQLARPSRSGTSR